MKMSQGDLREALNARLNRSYDKSRISRWENDREAIPMEVIKELELILSSNTKKAHIIALANQKGGVGKTTSALNLASALRRAGLRVLLIDLDPQASATDWILGQAGSKLHKDGKSIVHAVLKDKPLSDVIVSSDLDIGSGPRAFDIVGSHIDLSEADGRREPGFEHSLAEAIEVIAIDYDFIIVDAPPNLGLMTYMALVAADTVIVPVQTEPPDAMGVALLLSTVQKIQRRLNPHLRVGGILPTRYNSRQVVDREVLHHLIQYTSGKAVVLEPIPDSAVFGNAAWGGSIAVDASPRSKAVGPYIRLANALAKGEPPPLALLNLDATIDGSATDAAEVG
ncbi:ParA family protein [Acidisoma silvae]|uniref:ParA family protein n=2 Tax=Acidisoma silvae TaxID=2802396 RepID=A0A963YWN2_9PROT|nr:ParA family protein [Acidisoma silvae]